MEQHYLKLSNHNVFSPVRGYSSGIIKGRKLITRFPNTAKNSSHSIINDFYSIKNTNYYSNKSNMFFSSNSISLFSPKRDILNYRTIKSSKQKRIKSSSFQKKLPSVINTNNKSFKSYKSSSQNQFCFETEKLYHETYQIKKVIKNLEKQLYSLSNENIIKDRQLYQKEREINSIINNTHKTLDDDYNDDYKDNYYDYYNNNINLNTLNSSMGVLLLKIKKEIKNTNNEIKSENNKLNYLKKSFFITKTKELKVESLLLKKQYDKINTLISNALEIKSQNQKAMEEYNHLQETIDRQELILSSLESNCMSLEDQEKFLAHQLNILKEELKTKIIKAKKNNNELNILSIKNKNLTNDKVIQNEAYTTKINGVPITIKSLYTNKLSNLKKNINFYKRQIKFSDDMINKLKEQRKKLVDSNKNFEQKIKFSQKFIENTTQIKNVKRPQSSIGPSTRTMKDDDIIKNLRLQYKAFKEDEINLEQKANKYYEKLQEIEIENEEKNNNNEDDENQIEFGIDENNPYYTDNEENLPESNIKFTSSQFNQFTYILFKNFEAKNIVADEAKNKIIIPFSESIQKNNIYQVSYPSKEFDIIIEEFTKIIMSVLNSDNEYNHALTKIFVGALLYNCDCDTNKLVEYFSILFGYTRNYASEEKNYIEKLKTKYKSQTKKLVECITSYILNDLSSSQYFSLFKMKDLLDKNEIILKDKYIEFLFYYMKKFSDPDAKLEDLKFSLLNDIVPIGDTTVHSKAFIDDLDKDIEFENNIDNDNEKDINKNKKKKEKKDIFDKKEESIQDIKNIQNNEKNENNIEINKNNDKETNKDIKKDIKKDMSKENNKDMNYIEKEIKENKESKESKDNKKNVNEDKKENEKKKLVDNVEEKEDKKDEINLDEKKTESKIDNENYEDFEFNTNKDIDDNFDIDPNEIKAHKSTKEKEEDNNIDIDINKKPIENIQDKIDKDKIDDIEKIINDFHDKNEDIKKENDNNDNDNNNNDNTTKNNNNVIKKEINNNSGKNSERKEHEEIPSMNSENNKNNEPKLIGEEDKEDIPDTGNYAKKKKNKDTKDKNESNNSKIKKSKKYKEDEYAPIDINQEQNKKIENNKENEDQKSLNNDNIENNNDNNDNDNNGNNDNNDNNAYFNNEEDSVTEITNEEYRKQIIDSINLIQNSLKNNSTDFNSLIDDKINKNLINGQIYEYISIEDLNEKLLSLGINLTDLQLSCLCSKYCVPGELRLIDKKKFEKSLEDNLKGILIIE